MISTEHNYNLDVVRIHPLFVEDVCKFEVAGDGNCMVTSCVNGIRGIRCCKQSPQQLELLKQ